MESKKRNIRILFITPVPIKGAGTRCRIAQYLPQYKKSNIEGVISPFYFDRFFDIVYKKGHILHKTLFFVISVLRRCYDLIRLFRFDIVYIYREACPAGPPVFEWLFSRFKPVIYDFDDAIYLDNVSTVNRFVGFLKYPTKTRKIVEMSDHIIVCNDFLKQFAHKFNTNVSVIPISIDTDLYFPEDKGKKPDLPVIGWIGSYTTAKYLNTLKDVFKELSCRHRFLLRIIGAGSDIKIPDIAVESRPWTLEKEAGDYRRLDIGICPLGRGEWDLGKTGYKIIAYMAAGIPAVASDTGSNREIIKDGINGFLAAADDEWIDKISRLVENPVFRDKIGRAARETAVKEYSVKANTSKYIDIFNRVIQPRHEKI